MTYLDAEIQRMQFWDTPQFFKNAKLREFLRLKPIDPPTVLIDGLTIKAKKGEVVSLVGPSGVGKSTLLRILAGLETKFLGRVDLDGKAIKQPSRRIQIVFQNNYLLPWLDVKGNIAFALKDKEPTACAQKINNWINKVGLVKKAADLPKTLSGGEASRVAFARAFIAPPELLLLDEPFSALDTITKEGLQQELIRFATETATTVVLVSHSVDDAVFLSDRVIVLAGLPLRIFEEFSVKLKRPRDRENEELFKLALRIKEALRAAAHAQTSIPAA